MSEIKTWKERLQNQIYGYPEEMQCREDEVDELRTRIYQLEQELAAALASQAQQESLQIGKVQHFAAPEGAPVYVTVQWKGSPPKHGAKVYALPPAPEGGEK